ncbi:unnamed protein product [Toxocara canis]|uniref:Secreted protein n=1 Tax=Toxocara canis TaxID=6265 RepID=A0A183UXD5_TOXCA|nr:unnamed protein product [Toxocara canis]
MVLPVVDIIHEMLVLPNTFYYPNRIRLIVHACIMHIKIAWRALFVWLFLNVLLPRFCCQERATGHLDDDREGPQSWNAVELPSPSPAFTFLGETSTRYSTQASVNHPSVGVVNFSSMVSSNPIMRGVSEAAESSTRSPTAFTDEDSGVTVSASPTSSISYVPSSLATSDLIPTGKHFRRTAEEDAWGVFALAVSAISPVDDSGKDNFGEHYRVVNRTYFAQGLATSENEVLANAEQVSFMCVIKELGTVQLRMVDARLSEERACIIFQFGENLTLTKSSNVFKLRMFEERNGTRLEGDLRESLPIYVLNRTAHLHSTLPEKKGDASSTKMTTSSNENGMEETTKLPSTVADSIFVPHFLPVNSILLLTDDNATKAVQEHGAGDFVSDVSETNSVSRTGSINEPPFSATVHTFENSPQMWESPSAFAGSTRSSVGGGQHAFTDSSFWLDNMRTIQPTSSMFSSQVSAADQRGSTMSVNTVSRSSFENRTPNPWEMQRNDTTLVATESAMIADPELSSELDPLHFDRIAVADSNTVGADQSFDWRARTISYNHEETDSQTFASTSVPAASYNSEREWATKMNTATIEPYSVITSHRKPSVQVEGTARFYRVRNNAVSNREDGLNEGYSTGSQAVASPHHAEDQFVSDEGLRSSNELLHGAGDGRSDVFSMEFEGDQFIAAQKYKDLAVFDANVNENQQNRQEEGTELLGERFFILLAGFVTAKQLFQQFQMGLYIALLNWSLHRWVLVLVGLLSEDEYEYVYERSPNVEESGTLAKTVHSSDDLAMGLLLPSYPVFPYYPARQRGVSIAQSGRPLTAVEHVMLNGDLVERQRYLDGGRPVTVELWNRALHG